MAINFNSNISILAPFNLDAKYGVWSGADINTAKTNALNGIPSIYRAIGMTVGLFVGGNTTEYWFKSGITNSDLVEKTSGTTVSSGNLITVSGTGAINFTGGTNTGGNIVVRNSSGNNFGFQSSDGANGGLTIFGDLVGDSAVLTLLGTGASRFKMGDTDTLQFSSDSFNPNGIFAYFQAEDYGNSNNFSFINYGKGTFGGDAVGFYAILQGVSTASGGENQVGAVGYDTDAKFIFKPNANGGLGDFYSRLNSDGGNGLVFQYNGSNQAFFSSSNRYNFNGTLLIGADDVIAETPNGIIESRQSGNTSANLRLSGKTSGDHAILQFNPFTGSDAYINTLTGNLFFQHNSVNIARFTGTPSPDFIIYNDLSVGNNSQPTAVIEAHQSGNTIPNLKLTGKSSGSNARLDFAPFNGVDAYINNSTNTKVFFWTNGSGTSYYDASLFYFGSNRVQIDYTLSSNQSSLLIDPAYTSTGNSALTISGSSNQATTRGINIVHSYTGATSNAIYVGSAISASANLANAVNYNPTLTATANNDYLISLEVNPTFVSGAFTGVQNTAIRNQNGSNLFNTLSGNTIIGSGADSGAFKLDVYGASRVVLNSNSTGAIATVTGVDLTYGLRVNLERSASSKTQYGIYTRLQGGASSINYGVYGESVGGNLGYGGYFVGNGNNAANRSFVGVLGEATNYNGTSTASGIGGFFQVSQTITSGVAIPIIGNVTSDTAPTGTLKYLDLRLAGTSQFFVERNANKNRPAMMIGGTTVDNNAIIQADSTTQGFLPPRMTTAQKNAITTPSGLVVFDVTLGKLCVLSGTWQTITSA